MIIEEYPYYNREDRIRHYSDARFIIRQNETGNEYGEAIDIYPCSYTYVETDIPIETTVEATEADYLSALERLGVSDE